MRRFLVMTGTIAGVQLCTIAGVVSAQTDTSGASTAAAVEAAGRFHALLAAGDSAGVLALLAPDVSVVESGDVESRAHYIAHHLGADMAFARAVPSRREVLSVVREGNIVWLVSTSTASGSFRGRAIDSRGAELMVLARTDNEWRIRAVHWSSRPHRPPTAETKP